MRLSSATWIGIALIALTGCVVANQMHQPVGIDPPWVEKPANSHGLTFATVEYDDFGFPWNPQQLRSVLNEIHDANSAEQGAIVVTFVHGWRNNAVSQNRTDFEDKFLKPLAAQEQSYADALGCGAKPRRIIGIYIAWRGSAYRLFGWKGPDLLSFFGREATATRIASGVSVALLKIMQTTKQNQNSRSIVIGHSLGGLLVERALIPAITTQLVDAAEQKDRTPNPMTDLVIMINPAAQAFEAARLRDEIRWNLRDTSTIQNIDALKPYVFQVKRNLKDDEDPWLRWRPLLITIASEGDLVTGPLLHAAETLKTRRSNFGGRTIDKTKERVLARHAPAHTCNLVTHIVTVNPSKSSWPGLHACASTTGSTVVKGNPLKWFYMFGGAAGCRTSVVHDKESPYACLAFGSHEYELLETANPSRYWTLRVPSDIINGHSGMWKPASYDFLRGLIAFTGVLAEKRAVTPCPPLNTTTQLVATASAETSAALAAFGQPIFAIEKVSRISHCDLPSAPRITYTGLDSHCSPTSPLCFPAEPIEFDLAADEHMQCSEIDWAFDSSDKGKPDRLAHGRRVVRTFSDEVREGSTLTVTASASNDQGTAENTTIIRFGFVPPHDDQQPKPLPLAPAISFEGPRSRCDELSMPCITGEDVRFSVARGVPRDPGTHFVWSIDDRSEESPEITHRFESAGNYNVKLTMTRGKETEGTNASVRVIPKCEPAPEFDIVYEGGRSGCTNGLPCAAGEPVEFAVRPHGEYPLRDCHQIHWRYGTATRDDEQKPRFRFEFPGKHIVEATVETIGGSPEHAEIAIEVFPIVPPAPLVINFEGDKSHCTRQTVCTGATRCFKDESIRLLVQSPASLQPGDKIQWFVNHARTERSTLMPSDNPTREPRLVTATVTNEFGSSSDTMLVTFTEQPHPTSVIEQQSQQADTYSIIRGDCLSVIAERELKSYRLWPDLYDWNKLIIRDPHWIFPGQVLRLNPSIPIPEQPQQFRRRPADRLSKQ